MAVLARTLLLALLLAVVAVDASHNFNSLPFWFPAINPYWHVRRYRIKTSPTYTPLLSAADHATEPNTGGNHRRKRSLYYPGSGFFSKGRGNSGFRYVYGFGPYRRFSFGRRGLRNKVFVYSPGGLFYN